ncbi:hypothetical protein HYPSUDRAFT_203089 [Hypholoma sublateritium FD-334 SS-4]|uniref:Uncharacterized protein n=1 Tax=Hypholoma sublateritium (strain FD-334 SS-4) TaxID=945553 RepID=A0A0D2PN69_HYPSF|nr:hypothetical protein HYPSUDRAFT_203089 [Hypholoma sublateritium FD-334 SS-4]
MHTETQQQLLHSDHPSYSPLAPLSMKSAQKYMTRREALNKYVRAKAHREGTLFNTALDSVIGNENGTGAFVPAISGRMRQDSPRREIRERLRVERFAKAPAHDRAARSLIVDREDTTSEVHDPLPMTTISVSILDIARPAKQKGSAKGFEVVRKLRSVVALSEERGPNLPADDDWEHIYDEEELDTRPSYSSVLRRNER